MRELRPAEEWRPVVGYEGRYEVSSHGRVRSVDRVVRQLTRHGSVAPRRLSGRLLSLTPDLGKHAYGRLQVKLSAGGEARTRLVAHLVAEAFIGSRPRGQEVAHNNGVVADNHASNLRYATPAENSSDKLRHGTVVRGASVAQSKIDAATVRQIRKDVVEQSYTAVARRYGLSVAQVWRIAKRQRWGHVS